MGLGMRKEGRGQREVGRRSRKGVWGLGFGGLLSFRAKTSLVGVGDRSTMKSDWNCALRRNGHASGKEHKILIGMV